VSGGERRRAGKDGRREQRERIQGVFLQSKIFFGGKLTMPEPHFKGLVVPEEALRRGTSDQDSQDSKSHNSKKQKQVASDDDGGNGVDWVGSSSSGSSSQPRYILGGA
jgi:hypothetical protein